jgi:hypothetical protein
MIREAEHREQARFYSQVCDCTKEANEVVYWLEFYKATDYLNEKKNMKI